MTHVRARHTLFSKEEMHRATPKPFTGKSGHPLSAVDRATLWDWKHAAHIPCAMDALEVLVQAMGELKNLVASSASQTNTDEVLSTAIAFYELLNRFDCEVLVPIWIFLQSFSPMLAQTHVKVDHLYMDAHAAITKIVSTTMSAVADAIRDLPAKIASADGTCTRSSREKMVAGAVTETSTEVTAYNQPRNEAARDWPVKMLALHIISLHATMECWDLTLRQIFEIRLPQARTHYATDAGM